MPKKNLFLAAPVTIALVLGGSVLAYAQSSSSTAGMRSDATMKADDATAATSASKKAGAAADKEGKADADSLVQEAVKVVGQMKSDDGLANLLAKAKGVYIVPDFGRAGLIVGGRGGAGVMMAKNGKGEWTDPGFYDFGAISLGAQAGVSAGSVAFILMSDDAVQQFRDDNSFSLNADAGLSIINYSANAQAAAGKGDIIFWSDTEGAFAGAQIGISDVSWADDNTQAFYGQKVTPQKLLSGDITVDKADRLKSALSGAG